MDISECLLIGWEIGWHISRFGAYLPVFILLIHSEMWLLKDMADIFTNSILYLLRYFFQFPFFYS